MGSISGPIIRFRFDAPSAQQAARQLSQTVGSTMAKASKSSAQTFVTEWQAAAAKLRASLSTEKLGLNQIAQARQKIVGIAEREVSVLQKKNQLTKSEYALLKSATMEIERQKNAIEGFGSMTSPTRKIVQQMISGISARAGSYGGGFGGFAGVRVNESIGKMADEATGGKLALLGFGAAAVVATAAITRMAIKGAELAVSMRNASEAAGISIKSMAELKSASSALGIDSDVTVKMFKKFNQELTYASGASLPHASIQAKRAAEVFQLLGVNVQKAAADPMEGFRELSKALSTLPDGAIKSATEVMLLGRGGQEAAPLINHLAEAIAATKDSSDVLASKIGGAADAGDKLATTTANLSNQWHTLEVGLAQHLIPVLADVLTLINKIPGKQIFTPGNMAGVPIIGPAISAFMLAERARQAAQNTGGVTGSWTDSNNPTLKKIAGAIVSDSTGSGRKQDFSEPLYLGKALAEEWKKYQEMVAKSNEALKKHIELMAKLNAETFAKNSFMTTMLGPIGIAADSPDKTGAGIQKFFDAINEANMKTAKKAAEEWKNQFDKLKESVGGLFDAMLQGSKSFGQALKGMIETALLAPIKEAFSTKIAQLIQSLEKNIQAHAGKNAKGGGGVLAKIMATLGLGAPTTTAQQNVAQSNVNTMTVGSLTILGNTLPGGAGAPNIPKPTGNPFLSMFGGGGMNFSSLSTALGGMSLALAAPGGMAVAGSGGSNVAAPGGTVNAAGGVNGAVAQASGALAKISSNKAVQAIAPLIPGAALLGVGIGTRNGAAMAMGIGSLAGAGLTKLSNLSALQGTKIGGVLGTLGAAAPGIGMMFAGNQTGGLGGAAMGALGGAQAGLALGGPIGAAIGAIAGGLMGIFGKKNNEAVWQGHINKAMANQRITLPPSEHFAFASMGSMAQTMSTTFGQGPGGFSNSTLAANTPFWANAILGTPRNWRSQIQWNELMNGLNTNAPFYGGSINPFTGGTLPPGYPFGGNSGLPNGLRLPRSGDAYSQNAGVGAYGVPHSGVQVHFTVPGYVDKAGLADIVKTAAPLIHASVSQSVYRQNTGMRRAVSRAVNLP